MLWCFCAVRLQDIILETPELGVALLLLSMVLLHGDVDNGPCGGTGRQQKRRELYEVCPFTEKNLCLCMSVRARNMRRVDSYSHASICSTSRISYAQSRSLCLYNIPSFPTVNMKLSCDFDIAADSPREREI